MIQVQPTTAIPPPRTRNLHNETAQRLTGRDYLSYSSISAYQQCPLKYFFRYVADVPQEQVSVSLVFGQAMHSAIESYYRTVLESGEDTSVETLLAVFDSAWRDSARVPVRYGKSETPESLRERAGNMLEAFLNSPYSRMDGAILGIEETLRGSLNEACPDILGKVDLLVMDSESIRIIDFKTARSAWTPAKMKESAPQMHLYAELAAPIAQAFGKPIRIEWIVLTKTKVPSIDSHTMEIHPQVLTRTRAVVQRVWEAICAGHFYPCPSSMSCATCSYARACQQWDGAGCG